MSGLPETVQDETPRTAGGRLVIVENDDNVRRSLTLVLRARGYSVNVFRNAAELLSSRTPPQADCLQIDYRMPQMYGVELLKRLRARGNTTPALMLTGYYSPTLRQRAVDAGYFEVLEKPTDSRTLIDHIARAS